MPSDLKYLNALNSIPGVGVVTLRLLKNFFGDFEKAWLASETELVASGVKETALRSILWKRPSLDPDKEMTRLVKENIWLIREEDEPYPALLKEIPNPPMLIYGRGNINVLGSEDLSLAIVGTRRPTSYGLEAAELITRELTNSGIKIASGMALGIDSRAHQTALDYHGKTIAVLGSGLDEPSVFPQENRGLLKRIIESDGVVISEYAPGTPAFKENFPQRNRIISGISRGVVVVEAREKSGALITARFALEHGREVFAVPGSIFSPTSRGPNLLIGEGAKPVMSAKEILEELGIDSNIGYSGKINQTLGEDEKKLLEILEESLGIDEIKERLGLDTGAIVSALSMLELKGLIRNLGEDTYQRIQNL